MGLKLIVAAAMSGAALAIAATPAGAAVTISPTCPTSNFPYLSEFQFPVAQPEGFNDCTFTFGYLRIDVRTGRPQISIDTDGFINFDINGLPAQLPLSHDHGPRLDLSHPIGVISSLTTPSGELAAPLDLTFAYGSKGRLKSLTTTNKQPPITLTIIRDGAGRVTQIQRNGSVYVTFGYQGTSSRVTSYSDPGGDTGSFTYNAAGQLTQANTMTTATDPVDTFTYSSGGALASWDTFTFTTNAAGDVITTTSGASTNETISYASAHHPSSVENGSSSQIASFAYGARGRLIKATAAGGSPFEQFSYGANGLVSQITDQAANNFSFTYDSFARLTKIAGPGNELATIAYLPAPAISLESAHQVTRTGATIKAMINPHGLPTTYWLQYGRSTNYRHQTKPLTLAARQIAVAVKFLLAHLKPGTQYHYRVVAMSASGTSYGRDRTFKTKPRRKRHR